MKKKIVTIVLALLTTLSVSVPVFAESVTTDLSGSWLSENNDGSWMEAIIESDEITVNWVSDGGETRSIYWAGTYIAPAEDTDEYTWVSERDADLTDGALLASTNDTKEFSYIGGAISFEVTVSGITSNMHLYPEGYEIDYEAMYYDLLEQYEQLKADYDALTGADSAADTTVETEQAVDTGEATLGQKNALEQAKSYLSFTSFSYTGLIEQLEYEGYSTEEATYGADNCGADWFEQAVAKAKSYLSFSSFSRSGLIDQLEYEGFTAEQAEYAADAVGY